MIINFDEIVWHFFGYTLVKVYITARSTMFDGNTHVISIGPCASSLAVKLPEEKNMNIFQHMMLIICAIIPSIYESSDTNDVANREEQSG